VKLLGSSRGVSNNRRLHRFSKFTEFRFGTATVSLNHSCAYIISVQGIKLLSNRQLYSGRSLDSSFKGLNFNLFRINGEHWAGFSRYTRFFKIWHRDVLLLDSRTVYSFYKYFLLSFFSSPFLFLPSKEK